MSAKGRRPSEVEMVNKVFTLFKRSLWPWQKSAVVSMAQIYDGVNGLGRNLESAGLER
jgi:hypothetical protein